MDDLIGLQNIGAVSIFDFFIGLFEVLLLSIVFTYIYQKYSTSVSNRKIFSYQFVPYTVSIFLIVFTIKSSLVLSLGLVGALSIIRFRTAVKETEQIISLLYLTGVSIALAANQFVLPIISSIVVFLYYYMRNKFYSENEKEDNILVSEFEKFDETLFNDAINSIKKEFKINISIISFDEKDGITSIVLKVSEVNLKIIKSYKDIIKSKNLKLNEVKVY